VSLLVVTSSAEETELWGERWASTLPYGSVIALDGDLGAGKTTLVRGVVSALDATAHVSSPTFGYLNLYGEPPLVAHFDLYRLSNPQDFFSMGWDEHFGTLRLCIVEWAERLGDLLPADTIRVRLTVAPDGSHELKVSWPSGQRGT